MEGARCSPTRYLVPTVQNYGSVDRLVRVMSNKKSEILSGSGQYRYWGLGEYARIGSPKKVSDQGPATIVNAPADIDSFSTVLEIGDSQLPYLVVV